MEVANEDIALEVDKEIINTAFISGKDLRIYFNSLDYTKKDLTLIYKGREIKGTSWLKKAELVGLIIDDIMRRREENGTVSFPVDVDIDSDNEPVEDVSYDVDIQLDTLLQAEPEAEGWSDDEE